MAEGWIKLWRKARENPYLQDVVQRAVFFTLLLDAEHEPTERKIKRAVVLLQRGQSLITERELAAELKLGREQIRRAIRNLKRGGLINPQTNPQTNPETNPGWTLITICNFNHFQRNQPTANPEANPETNPTLRILRKKESKIPPSPSESPPQGGRKQGCRISPDFWPSEEAIKHCRDRLGCSTQLLDEEFPAFKGHFLVATGTPARKLDWDQTFVNWMRRARRDQIRREQALQRRDERFVAGAQR